MTEKEYVDLTNLVLLRSVMSSLGKVMFIDESSTDVELKQQAATRINTLISRLESKVKTK